MRLGLPIVLLTSLARRMLRHAREIAGHLTWADRENDRLPSGGAPC